jgi:hypothetical protein
MLRTLLATSLLALAAALPAAAQERGYTYTPTQAAYLKAEIRKAQERFVDKAAAVSGVPQARIRDWMPTDGRDVPPKVSILPALARERGKPLTEEERATILAADQERFQAIEQAKQAAQKK